MLSQANLTLDLLSLCLQGNGHATPEDHIDLSHLFIVIRIDPAMLTTTGLLGHRRYWWRHLLAIQKSLAHFQIMPCSAMNITPLFCIGSERPLLLLFEGLLAVVSVILAVSMIGRVNFPGVLLLLRGPLATRLKELSPSLRSLDAHVSDHEQIGHRFRLLHGYLLHSLDVANPIMKGVDDFNVLDVWDSVSGIAKMFYVVPEALIKLLLDGLQGFCSRQTLVCALKVLDEHGT
jgi:hypothetical protein